MYAYIVIMCVTSTSIRITCIMFIDSRYLPTSSKFHLSILMSVDYTIKYIISAYM